MWFNTGHYTITLSKGVKTATWVWNLYLITHDFEYYNIKSTLTSKVFAFNLNHLSTILLWLGGIHFYGIYYFNYNSWLLSPKIILISAHIVWFIIKQELFNMDLGTYFG